MASKDAGELAAPPHLASMARCLVELPFSSANAKLKQRGFLGAQAEVRQVPLELIEDAQTSSQAGGSATARHFSALKLEPRLSGEHCQAEAHPRECCGVYRSCQRQGLVHPATVAESEPRVGDSQHATLQRGLAN